MAELARSAVWVECCPECKKQNFFNEGSKYDVEGLKCWNCSHIWLLESTIEVYGKDALDEIFEEAYIEEGRKKV
ncbi:MAG TPA: hypothetical protein PLP33_25380 [Leptospiraceae bacterium]|nr:hypothetical protein [Leptospiraceae bacterium]